MSSNNTPTVTSVSAIAISGEAMAMSAERSARRSSTNCMLRLLPAVARSGGAAHEQAQRFPRRFRGAQRLRKLAAKHDRDAVGDLFDFVEVLADDQHRGAAAGEIDQRLADGRRRAGID